MTELKYTDKDGNSIQIEPNEEWVNYGDADPKRHGGIFVRFDGNMWHVVETIHHKYLPEGLCDGKIMINDMHIEPQDLFTNGNPNDGATEGFEWVIESLSNVDGYENALVDFDIEYFIACIIDYRHYNKRDEYIDVNNYWTHLESKYEITEDSL